MGEKKQGKPPVSEHYRQLMERYGNISPEGVLSAFSRTGLGAAMTFNPYMQNNRIKGISSRAFKYDKNQVASYLDNPDNSEKPLRQAMEWVRYSAYPIFNIIKTYQDVPTYRWYNYPLYLDSESSIAKDDLLREWRLLEKICGKMDVRAAAHRVMGECGISGKVHYYLRKKIDKAHNTCEYAYLQRIPQDWIKIVGFNNISKYTLMFDMMYFLQPGTDYRQFGDLFEPYVRDMQSFIKKPRSKIVYSSKRSCDFDLEKIEAEKKRRALAGNPDVYEQNGTWFYWVTLPPTECWTFEIDDTTMDEISPFTGLLISAIQQADYEAVQLSILQNPLVACVLGEMETINTNTPTQADPIKISPAVRDVYLALWYNMMAQNNTSGIGIYAAPFKDMKLNNLAEAPNAENISAAGYSYLIQKSGIGIISASAEPRVGMVNVAAAIAAKFGQCVYMGFERMINYLYGTLNLKYEWGFKMFGDIFSEKDDLKAAKDGMTLGLLIETLRYDALRGHSLLEDISISSAIEKSNLLSKRIPLISSYSAKNPDSGANPSPGRPSNDTPQSEGAEDDADSYGDMDM